MIPGWSTYLLREAEGDGLVQSGEERDTTQQPPVLPGGHQEVRTRPLTGVNGKRIRVNRHKWKQERVNLDIRKTVFVLGGFQDRTGSRLEQPGLVS